MLYALIILSAILVVALIQSIRYYISLSKSILEIEDAVEEAISACEVTYVNVSQLLDKPIAVLNPEVMSVIEQMKNVRDTVHYVSNVLAEPFGGIEEENEDQKEKK